MFQLRAHGATAQARLMQLPPGQQYYEIGQGGRFMDPSGFVDPFNAYRMGVQHGLSLMKGKFDDMEPEPPPPKKRQEAWSSEMQLSRCNSGQVSRTGSQLQCRPSTASIRDNAPKKTTAPSRTNYRNPSEICLDIEKQCKTLPSAKEYAKYNYNLQPQKKKKTTKQTMSCTYDGKILSDGNIFSTPAPFRFRNGQK
jgi:hypothetical protein